MINVITPHFEYRIRKVFVGQDGKSDCEVQRKYKDGWGLVENRRVRGVLAYEECGECCEGWLDGLNKKQEELLVS